MWGIGFSPEPKYLLATVADARVVVSETDRIRGSLSGPSVAPAVLSERSRLALALGALAVAPVATLAGSDAAVTVLLPLAVVGPVLAGVGAAVADRSRGLCGDRSDRVGFLALLAGAGALWGFVVGGAHLTLVESGDPVGLVVVLLLFGSLAGAIAFSWIAVLAGPFYAATLLALPPGERPGDADSR